MIINTSTELMKNQKHAVLMAPDKQFEVLQTQEGNALFFSIGTDGIFYVTREIPQDVQGWSKFDLSTVLSGSPVKAVSFDVAQNIAAGTIDIALAVSINGQYQLYTALALPNTDAAWNAAVTAGKINFTSLPFDDTTYPSYSALPIADVYVSKVGNTKMVVADIQKDASTGAIFRYFVDPTKKIMGNNLAWNPRDPGGNFTAGTIQSALGRKDGAPVDGMYTFGTIGGTPQLIYNPLYFIDNKKIAPKVSRLEVDPGSTAMALSANSDNLTDVFVAANGGLWFLDCEDQDDETPLDNVYSHPLFSGVKSLHVNNNGTNTIVWALNQQGQIFYMTAAAGSEDDQSAWSYPMVILEQVEGVATYVHSTKDHIVIFANTQDQGLIRLTQDPASSKWTQRKILLPTADYTDIVKDYTFTTHIELTDDQKQPLPNQDITISASSTSSVYINNIYHQLFAQQPLTITTDAASVITIVQAIDSLGGITFTLTDGTSRVYVNPLETLIDKLKNVTGDDLNKQVYDENGTPTQLTTNLDSDTRSEIATYIQNFIALNGNLNPDGTPVADNSLSATQLSSGTTLLGMNLSKGKAVVYTSEQEAAAKGVTPVLNKAAAPAMSLAASNGAIDYEDGADLTNSVLILAGDGWNWLKKEFGNIERWEIRLIGNINHFIFELAGKIYHFAIRCAHDIAEGIHFILSKIEIAFEQMIQWLGMIFSYKDIKNTHNVLKNVFNKYLTHLNDNFSNVKDDLTNAFSTLKDEIDALTGLPDSDQTYGSCNAQSSNPPGSKSPSANYGTHHLKSNTDNCDNGGYTNSSSSDDPTGGLLDTLIQTLQNEGDAFSEIYTQLKAIAENVANLTVTDFIKQVIGAILDFVVNTAENILLAVADILYIFMQDITGVLNAPINVPVLSWLYKEITGDDFTIMDLTSFVAAIPVTVIYKATRGVAPFPDDDPTTAQLINAPDLTSIANIIMPPQPASPAAGFFIPDYHVTVGSLLDRFTIACNILSLTGAVIISIIGYKKAMDLEGGVISPKNSNIMTGITSSFYLAYAAPDILGFVTTIADTYPTPLNKWYVPFNNVCLVLGCGKAVVDATSIFWKNPDKIASWGDYVGPVTDCIINAVWQIPTTGQFVAVLDGRKASVEDANTIVGFIGGSMFDASGILSLGYPLAKTFASSPDKELAAREGIAIAQSVANLIWGGACVVTSFDGIHTT
ncbi:MAG: hypothetical protein QM802_18240 [Agriterribacter sp.]